MKYRPDIDGLRALAVLPVILFHLHWGVPGGYAGVDVFFVISGFLITGLVLKGLNEGTFSLLGFWERRVRRLFPAFAAVLLATLVFGYLFFLPNMYLMLTHSAFAQLFAASNIYFFRGTGYFAPTVEFVPLLHTWTLAVEEQFYLILPVFLFLIWKSRPQAGRMILTVCFVLSLLLCCLGISRFPYATFYLLPARAWELLMGAMLVLYPIKPPAKRWVREWISVLGVVALLITFFGYSSATPFPGIHALLPCLGTVAIILMNRDRLTFMGRFLSLKPMVFIGVISYSLYLWHWPLLCFLNYSLLYEELTVWHKSIFLLVVFIVASFSWRFIETPFRSRKLLKSKTQVFSAALVTTAMLAGFCLFIHFRRGFEGRLPEKVARFHPVSNHQSPLGDRVVLTNVRSHDFPVVGDPAARAGSPRFMLWGDSHAGSIAGMFDRYAKESGCFGYASYAPESLPVLHTYLPSVGKELLERNQATFDFIVEKKIPHVILVGKWSVYTEPGPNGETEYLLTDTDTPAASPQAAREILARRLKETIQALKEAGVQVWVLKPLPSQVYHVPQMMGAAMLLGKEDMLKPLRLDEHFNRHAFIYGVLDELKDPAVHVVDPLPYFKGLENRTLLLKDGISLYRDEDHLSEKGASLLRPLFEPLFGPE